MFRRSQCIAVLLAALGAGLMALSGNSRASDAPATFALNGQVRIASGLALDAPDLSRVVLFMESDRVLDAAPLPTTRPQIAQQDKEFVPNFLVVPKGTQVEFPNYDHFFHNVFSRSAAAPAFDLDRYPYGESKTASFDHVGVVQVFCNIHPSMKAILFVTPNTFFTHADGQGRFAIAGLPAGHYRVSAWQERCRTQTQSVDVGSGSSGEISLTLGEDRDSILANDPPQRDSGYGVERGLGVKREVLNLPVVGGVHPAPPPATQPCPLCN